MDDEEMLFKQVQMTAAATPGTTVWVYRCSIYAYPWYTSVRALLDDEAYAPWFINFKADGPAYLKMRKPLPTENLLEDTDGLLRPT